MAVPEYSAIAMLPISSLGSTEEAMASIARVLAGELGKLAGEPAQLASRRPVITGPRLVTADRLEQSYPRIWKDLLRCDFVTDCALEVLGAHGWDAFIVGNIAGLGDERVINLKLIDVRSGTERRRASEKASGDESELIKQMRKAAVLLLAPELFTGTLEIHAAQPGVQIIIDGQMQGTTPLAQPRFEVLAGKHAVEATGEGLVPFESLVEVAYGEVVPLNVMLPENTVFVGGDAPFRARWWTWTLAAAGAASGGLGGYFYYQHTQTADRISKRAERGTLTHADTDMVDAWDRDYKVATGLFAAGGLLVTTVGTLLVIDLL
jgi:hypothetical protein